MRTIKNLILSVIAVAACSVFLLSLSRCFPALASERPSTWPSPSAEPRKELEMLMSHLQAERPPRSLPSTRPRPVAASRR
jgi:hypothetical protein